VRVEVLEPEVVALELAERHFGLRLDSAGGRPQVLGLEGQDDAEGSPSLAPRKAVTENDDGGGGYAAVVALGRGPAGTQRWEPLRRLCGARQAPVLLLEAPCGARQALCASFGGFRVVELQAG